MRAWVGSRGVVDGSDDVGSEVGVSRRGTGGTLELGRWWLVTEMLKCRRRKREVSSSQDDPRRDAEMPQEPSRTVSHLAERHRTTRSACASALTAILDYFHHMAYIYRLPASWSGCKAFATLRRKAAASRSKGVESQPQ